MRRLVLLFFRQSKEEQPEEFFTYWNRWNKWAGSKLVLFRYTNFSRSDLLGLQYTIRQILAEDRKKEVQGMFFISENEIPKRTAEELYTLPDKNRSDKKEKVFSLTLLLFFSKRNQMHRF
jgi:hypothetical protein